MMSLLKIGIYCGLLYLLILIPSTHEELQSSVSPVAYNMKGTRKSFKPAVQKEDISCDKIWATQEAIRKCTTTPEDWKKYLEVQYLYLQIENLKVDIERKKKYARRRG
ncbi:uncharacterized protein O3C94_002520 [Discoglossus pictus]